MEAIDDASTDCRNADRGFVRGDRIENFRYASNNCFTNAGVDQSTGEYKGQRDLFVQQF